MSMLQEVYKCKGLLELDIDIYMTCCDKNEQL